MKDKRIGIEYSDRPRLISFLLIKSRLRNPIEYIQRTIFNLRVYYIILVYTDLQTGPLKYYGPENSTTE